MKNRYSYRCRISEGKIREIVRCFSIDLAALQTAQLIRLNRNTINRFYQALRQCIYMACENEMSLSGVVEVRKTRPWGLMRKTTVFGIFGGWDGKVSVHIVSNCSKATLQDTIKRVVLILIWL